MAESALSDNYYSGNERKLGDETVATKAVEFR